MTIREMMHQSGIDGIFRHAESVLAMGNLETNDANCTAGGLVIRDLVAEALRFEDAQAVLNGKAAEREARERDREIGAAVRSLMEYAHARKLHGLCWEIEMGIYCHPPHQEWYYVSEGGPRPDHWKQHGDVKTAIEYALDALHTAPSSAPPPCPAGIGAAGVDVLEEGK